MPSIRFNGLTPGSRVVVEDECPRPPRWKEPAVHYDQVVEDFSAVVPVPFGRFLIATVVSPWGDRLSDVRVGPMGKGEYKNVTPERTGPTLHVITGRKDIQL